MRTRGILDRIWSRRLWALRKHWRAATEGDVRAVHQARVASRRLREALPILGLSVPTGEVAKVRKAVRRVTRALGPVREADVTLALLEDIGKADPHLLPAITATRHRVEEARDVRRRLMLDQLGPSGGTKTIARLEGVRQYPDPPTGQWRTLLAERTETRARDLQQAVEEAGILYEPERLHQIRIAAKKLRYSLELVGESRLASTTRLVNQLKALQDHLGHLHDLQVLAAHAGGLPAAEFLAVSGDRFVRHLDDRCHDLHARFLAGRSKLLALTSTVVETLIPRLTERGSNDAADLRRLTA